jgi:hypothetical protein
MVYKVKVQLHPIPELEIAAGHRTFANQMDQVPI